MGTPNQYGILSRDERVVLCRGPKYGAVAALSISPGTNLWAFGINVWAGKTEVDSFRFSFAPSVRNAVYASRDECLLAARRAAIARFQEHIEWAESGGRGMNPVVNRACKAAIRDLISNAQQSVRIGGMR